MPRTIGLRAMAGAAAASATSTVKRIEGIRAGTDGTGSCVRWAAPVVSRKAFTITHPEPVGPGCEVNVLTAVKGRWSGQEVLPLNLPLSAIHS